MYLGSVWFSDKAGWVDAFSFCLKVFDIPLKCQKCQCYITALLCQKPRMNKSVISLAKLNAKQKQQQQNASDEAYCRR